MADQTEAGILTMARVAIDEVQNKTPDCSDWLREKNILITEATNQILIESLRIKTILGIENKYGSGVGENDLIIIATAMLSSTSLVTDESRQTNLPQQRHNYKIPAVCNLPDINIVSMNFLDYIKESGRVFR